MISAFATYMCVRCSSIRHKGVRHRGGFIFAPIFLCLRHALTCSPIASSNATDRLQTLVRSRLYSSLHRTRYHQHVLLLQQHHLANDDQHLLHARGPAVAESRIPLLTTRRSDYRRRDGIDVLRLQDQALAVAANLCCYCYGYLWVSSGFGYTGEFRAYVCYAYA